MIWRMALRAACSVLLSVAILACGGPARPQAISSSSADIQAFLARVNETMLKLGVAQARAGWTQQTYINDDTEAIAARANQEYLDALTRFAKEATAFDRVTTSPEQRRQLTLLKVGLVMAT